MSKFDAANLCDTGSETSTEVYENQDHLPVRVADSYEMQTPKDSKDKKNKRKSRVSAGVYMNQRQRYLNEELFPEIDEKLFEVCHLRSKTSHDIDHLYREANDLELKRLESAPPDVTDDMGVALADAEEAVKNFMNSGNLERLNNALKEAEDAMKRLEASRARRKANKAMGKIFG